MNKCDAYKSIQRLVDALGDKHISGMGLMSWMSSGDAIDHIEVFDFFEIGGLGTVKFCWGMLVGLADWGYIVIYSLVVGSGIGVENKTYFVEGEAACTEFVVLVVLY